MLRTWRPALLLLLALTLTAAACGDNTEAGIETGTDAQESDSAAGGGEAVSGSIEVDGSSTVAPLTEAIAEIYAEEAPDVQVNVATSGTGGGFERFCANDLDIADASRPIKDEEIALCEEAGVEFTELRVGTDALTVVVNPQNDFATCLTSEELITIFGAPGATNWNEVNPEFPDLALDVFAPGADSGTFDFFLETLEIDEEPGARAEYNASEDDNIIVQGVQGTEGGWGYFGFAFFQNNAQTLKAVEVDGGEGCVAPSAETAKDESYLFTRPLFIYVNNEALQRPEVGAFSTFYLENVNSVIEDVGYIPEDDAALEEAISTLEDALGG